MRYLLLLPFRVVLIGVGMLVGAVCDFIAAQLTIGFDFVHWRGEGLSVREAWKNATRWV